MSAIRWAGGFGSCPDFFKDFIRMLQKYCLSYNCQSQYTAYTLSRELFLRSHLQTKARIANPLAEPHEYLPRLNAVSQTTLSTLGRE